jgi:hypothetical protein
VTGLDNGVGARFRVSAINATGTGTSSSEVTAMPRRSSSGTEPTPTPTPDPETPGPSDEASEGVPGGGVVTTDPGGGGPTQGQPVTATVRTPVGGTVTIDVNQPRGDDDIDGLDAFARGVDVVAPDTSSGEPLRITLRVDASELPGTAEGGVVLLKDGEPVTASCRSDGAANPDPCVVVRTINDDGDLVVEVLSSEGGRFIFTEPTHACPRSLTVTGRFSEVIGVHAGAVDCITWWRPSTGFTDDTYRDQIPMTRGQLASIVAASLETGGVELPDPRALPFADLRGSVHAEAVAKLTELGIINDIDGDTFAPYRSLTRARRPRPSWCGSRSTSKGRPCRAASVAGSATSAAASTATSSSKPRPWGSRWVAVTARSVRVPTSPAVRAPRSWSGCSIDWCGAVT